MPSYTAPLRDMQFVYNELFDPTEITALPGCEDATADLVEPVLEEAARLAQNELFPLNHSGDSKWLPIRRWQGYHPARICRCLSPVCRGRLGRTAL